MIVRGDATGASPSAAARAAAVSPKTSSKSKNPLHGLMAAGKMPVILELHVTEGDKAAYQRLHQRHLAQGYELPQLTVLGQYLRQMDVTGGELTAEERAFVYKLQTYADLVSSARIDLLALSDGPRGRDTLDNAIASALLVGLGVDPARLMANIVARDRQADQLRGRLLHFAELGIRNVLLLTGDLPVGSARPSRFPLDSVGLCSLARKMLVEGALPDDFWIAAAGHPNPDADPDGLRTLQKTQAGARLIITQAIYSIEQFTRWMQDLNHLGVLDQVHVLAEVIPITSASQLRSIADVPGMRVPGDLIAGLDAARERLVQAAAAGGHPPQWVEQHLRNEGACLTRGLLHRIREVPGVSGFYLGCVKGFEAHLELLREAPLLPGHGQSLHRVTKLSGAERQVALAHVNVLETFIDRLLRQARRRKRWTRWGARLANRRWVQALFKLMEWPKLPLFGCKQCDRCDLSPDALICPRGCAKQMTHGPCGAPRLVNGRMLCEDTTRECTWSAIRAGREHSGVPIAERLEVREAPSAGFYMGRTYSAVLPVLTGEKRGPNWGLAWRTPLARVARVFRRDFRLKARGDPRDLTTLAESQGEQLLSILQDRHGADREELLLKALALIGTPAAWCLIESRLMEFGLPAEGAIVDLSLREQFQLAEALPMIRRRFAKAQSTGKTRAPQGLCEELLSVIPEGRSLRQGMRRELANPLISHIALQGVTVTYSDSMLDTKFVDDFLSALVILKDELQMTRARLPFEDGGLSVDFHRVHYKHHYHGPVAIHRFHSQDGNPIGRVRLRIDLGQFQSAAQFRTNLRDTLEKLVRGEGESCGAIVLEDYGPGRQGLCWEFNAEFWKRLREFEQATGKSYDASIGGSTDHNLAYARASARALFDKIHAHHLGGQRLYVLEIGVASTCRARSFLNEFHRICDLTRTDYHRHITYVLADYSDALLAEAAAELSREHPLVESVRIEAGNPSAALARYHAQVIHAHLCNVYDNLPADHALWMDGSWHGIEARLYLPRQAFDGVLAKHGFGPADKAAIEDVLKTLASRGIQSARTQHGNCAPPAYDQSVSGFLDWSRTRLTELGRQPDAYVHFWMDLFAALRLEERYVDVADVRDLLLKGIVGVDLPGEVLQRHLADTRDIRVHLNQAALNGFAQLLPILHPHGTLEIVDLFVQRLDEYHQSFKGPAKYDGSTVNWLNGPLFRAVAEHLGYTVRFQPFRPFEPRSASVALLAYPTN